MKRKALSQSRNIIRKKDSYRILPVIPDKRYFTISEAADLCGVKPHVLRYWEVEFSQLKPIKRRGNRRYYQQEDLLIARQIRKFLYEDGFTIEGAKSQFLSNPTDVNKSVKTDAEVKKIIADLELILQKLRPQEIS